MTKEKIKLTDILNTLEFGYKINDDNTLSLIDLTGANWGDIESDKFTIDESIAEYLFDRLERYLNDYFFDGYRETLIEECFENVSESYSDILERMKKYPDKFGNCINMAEAIVSPELVDISDILESKNIKIKCFRCGARLLKSPVEGYTYFCPECYEDFYKIEQGKDKKCLKDMIFTTEMMNSLANTITKMKLSKMLKGFTTNILQWKKTIMKSLR